MFFGHIAVGLAAKPVTPKASLGALLVSATAIDTLAGVFAVTQIEGVDGSGNPVYPWSHGLFMAGVWSVAGLAVAFLLTRDRRTSLTIGLVVFSHWILDFISHPMGMGRVLPPDLPLLFEGSSKVGLGLYNSVPAALSTDFGLFIAGVAFYLARTQPKDSPSTRLFWLMVLSVFAMMVPGVLPSLAFMPTFAVLLLFPIGNWVDRHRVLVSEGNRDAIEPAGG